jgi:hypothetical protein
MTKITAVVSAALLCAATANAQSAFGTIAGLVRDSAKAPVADAMITVTKKDGGSIRTTISNSGGLYSFADVAPGEYSAVAQAPGLPDITLASLKVTAGQATRADLNSTAAAPATISSLGTPNPALNQGVRPQPSIASLGLPPAGSFTPRPDLAKLDLPPLPSPVPSPAPQDPKTAMAPAAPATPPAPAVDNDTPFAYADFTWMNAVPRNHDSVLDGKYFSPEVRVDTNYIYDYNHPIDHTLGGTTEGERTGEVVLQQLNVGGDFHWDHMQMRFLTQIGATATAVPRNDASPSVGQWNLSDAYRYITEGYAGYHMNVQHGLNLQAGIFMSFIGLYSYYSFDNWGYQPSYVSSNTPWFFNGFRMQWFPTNKLKFEPWLINGWQSYAKFNGKPGLGGQILWRPTGNLDFVWNTYALGQDTIATHRTRLHEDDSMEWKYYENPDKLMHRMAFSFTFDIGCETGGGTQVVAGETPGVHVNCFNNSAKTGPAQNFIGAMLYQRFWFDHDKFGATVGGGFMANPGGYLVLLPPINGATATSGIPYNYFPVGPGVDFKGYDYQLTFDWMPSQFVTWRVEFVQRGTNIPYFTGPGGITPPGGNNGVPTQYVCNDGAPSATGACGNDGGLWTPDLKKQERRWTFALMVHL